MKTKIIALLSILISQTCLAEWRGAAGFTSDYAFRGWQYSENTSAATLFVEYQSNMGFYGSVWLSEQEQKDIQYRGQRELDYILGYVGTLSESTAYDLSYTRYTFPKSVFEYDWEEINLAFHVGQQWTMLLGVNRSQFRQGENGSVVELTYRDFFDVMLVDNVLVDMSLGRVGNESLVNNYYYYEIGFSKQFKKLQSRIAWTDTHQNGLQQYILPLIKSEWSASLTYRF